MTPQISPDFSVHRSTITPRIREYLGSSSTSLVTIPVIRQAPRIIVIGGGASGLMAAGRAAACGANVILLEKMARLGLKLGITGKGRCNVTNAGSFREHTESFLPDGRFLINAFHRFFNQELIEFLDKWGVPTVTERGKRVFPASGRALDVVSALLRFAGKNGVHIEKTCAVRTIRTENGKVTAVETSKGLLDCDSVLLATGGCSYPQTGSTGDGFRMAQQLGHTIAPVRPYLVPLVTGEAYVPDLQGLALKNVNISVLLDGRKLDEEFGEMLFTHFGISGPAILTLSSTAVDNLGKGLLQVSINLKPALDNKMLDERLSREFRTQGRKEFRNVLLSLLPKRLSELIPSLVGIPAEKKGGQITVEERKRLAAFLHDWRLTITDSRPISEAIITAGGVLTKEINPITMESKKIEGLYFCGEVMDLQAKTGGYNLQMAFSTGWIAGESAALKAK